jgi:hypothetical protein
LTDTFKVNVGDTLSTHQFGKFKVLFSVKRILSFSGWTFSTHPTTYHIFRNGVTPANRLKIATNIANFKEHNLDGVDIDWEYPGASPFLFLFLFLFSGCPYHHPFAPILGWVRRLT